MNKTQVSALIYKQTSRIYKCMATSTTTKVYKEQFSSVAKAKAHASNLRKGGIKARVSKIARDKKK